MRDQDASVARKARLKTRSGALGLARHKQTATMVVTSTTAAPALNVYRKIAVIRKPSDSLTYEDEHGNTKSVLIEELGTAITAAVSCCCWISCYWCLMFVAFVMA
jgi:hypothetical protein